MTLRTEGTLLLVARASTGVTRLASFLWVSVVPSPTFPSAIGPDLMAEGSGGDGVDARRPGQNSRNVLEQLNASIEGAAVDHVESNIGIPVVDPLPALFPVITGKTTTR